MLRALIYLPESSALAAGAACMEYIRASGYQLEGVIIGRWQDMWDLLVVRRTAEIVVVAERSHIPTDQTPRIEIVREENLAVARGEAAVRAAAGSQRPRLIA